jgi:hypothetical protein
MLAGGEATPGRGNGGDDAAGLTRILLGKNKKNHTVDLAATNVR